MEAISELPSIQRHSNVIRRDPSSLEEQLKGVWQHAVRPNGPGSITPAAYVAALSTDRPDIQRRFSEAFATTGAEALLFPTTPCTAPLIESQYQFSIAGKDVSYAALAKNTVPASGAGLPGSASPWASAATGFRSALRWMPRLVAIADCWRLRAAWRRGATTDQQWTRRCALKRVAKKKKKKKKREYAKAHHRCGLKTFSQGWCSSFRPCGDHVGGWADKRRLLPALRIQGSRSCGRRLRAPWSTRMQSCSRPARSTE